MGIAGIELLGWLQSQAEDDVVRSVRESLLRIFESKAAEGITIEAAVSIIAEQCLSAGK